MSKRFGKKAIYVVSVGLEAVNANVFDIVLPEPQSKSPAKSQLVGQKNISLPDSARDEAGVVDSLSAGKATAVESPSAKGRVAGAIRVVEGQDVPEVDFTIAKPSAVLRIQTANQVTPLQIQVIGSTPATMTCVVGRECFVEGLRPSRYRVRISDGAEYEKLTAPVFLRAGVTAIAVDLSLD